MARLCTVLVVLVLGALMIFRPEDVPQRYQPGTSVDLTEKPDLLVRWKIRLGGLGGAMCRQSIAEAKAQAAFLPDLAQTERCYIRNRVRIAGLSGAGIPKVDTSCAIAARLYLWERHHLQPAARRILGARVIGISHFSSYSCRAMRTSRGSSTRMSEHATANAFDISGFRLSDGRTVSVARDWPGDGPKAQFLRAARDGLCDWFNVTLSPDYNALHADHFHVDMGPFLTCR